jgi:hypothetical protein
MAKSKDKTSHPKKGLDKKALIEEGIHTSFVNVQSFDFLKESWVPTILI